MAVQRVSRITAKKKKKGRVKEEIMASNLNSDYLIFSITEPAC